MSQNWNKYPIFVDFDLNFFILISKNNFKDFGFPKITLMISILLIYYVFYILGDQTIKNF